MKLNKEICKKCRNSSIDTYWLGHEEIRWKKGEMWCPYVNGSPNCDDAFPGISRIIKIDEIPDKCRYKLEHVVMNEEKS